MRYGRWGAAGLALVAIWAAAAAQAGEADVLEARATQVGAYGDTVIWRFDVTIEHIGASWDHYVDRIEVLAANGALLGYRRLYAPYEGDVSFDEVLSGVEIPREAEEVFIRVHDSVHGYGGREVKIMLAPADGGS